MSTDTRDGEQAYREAICREIVRQLGGRRLAAMIGVKLFMLDPDTKSVAFKFMRNESGANHCRVALDPSDTYTVTFSRSCGVKHERLKEFTSVYCDQLCPLFESFTGLAVSL